MLKSTITDIAQATGVSPSTVSRALAGNPRVSEATRRLIEEKASELGYERNELASNLRRGIARTVGIIVPRINREFFSNIISSAEEVLGEAGYSVIICQSHENVEDEVKALRTMRSKQVAGILISHSTESVDGSHIAAILTEGMELVQFDRVFSDLPGPKVVNDGVGGGYEATKHLIANGYRKIGTLAGYLESESYLARNTGYRKALVEAGREVDEGIIFTNSILRDNGRESAREAIAKGCDALYCAGDFSALGALEAAKEAGLRVPEDFGVVGTANEQFTALMSPSLSSIEQYTKEMGRQAALAFLRCVEGQRSDGFVVVPMKLVARESSSRVSSSDGSGEAGPVVAPGLSDSSGATRCQLKGNQCQTL